MHCGCGAIGSTGDAEQNHFGRNVGISEALGAGLCCLQSRERGTAEGSVLHGSAGCLGQLLNFSGCGLGDSVYIQACSLEDCYSDAFTLVHQSFEDVRGFNSGVTSGLSVSICRRDDFLTLGGELIVHDVPFVFRGLILCAPALHNLSLLHSIILRNRLTGVLEIKISAITMGASHE